MRIRWSAIGATSAFVLGLTSLCAQVSPSSGRIAVHSVKEIAGRNPIDPATGRAITLVASGKYGTVTVWQFSSGIAPHLHREHDEVIYCTEGEGIARLGDEKIRMKAGDFVVIPPNTPHAVTVTSHKPMRGISVFSPVFDGKDRVPVGE